MKTTKLTPSKKSRRGGARPGAGRKPAEPSGPRANFAGARVNPLTNGLLVEEARRRGIGLGQLLDQLAEGLGELQHVIYDVQRRAAQSDRVTALDSLIAGMITVAQGLDGVSVGTVFASYKNAKDAIEAFTVAECPADAPKLSDAELATLDRYIALAKSMGSVKAAPTKSAIESLLKAAGISNDTIAKLDIRELVGETFIWCMHCTPAEISAVEAALSSYNQVRENVGADHVTLSLTHLA